jgi:hypothetical protein
VATKVPKPPPTFVDRLAAAAASAVKQETPALSWQPERVRALVVEIDIGNRGEIREARSYVQRIVSSRGVAWRDDEP